MQVRLYVWSYVNAIENFALMLKKSLWHIKNLLITNTSNLNGITTNRCLVFLNDQTNRG